MGGVPEDFCFQCWLLPQISQTMKAEQTQNTNSRYRKGPKWSQLSLDKGPEMCQTSNTNNFWTNTKEPGTHPLPHQQSWVGSLHAHTPPRLSRVTGSPLLAAVREAGVQILTLPLCQPEKGSSLFSAAVETTWEAYILKGQSRSASYFSPLGGVRKAIVRVTA